MLRMPEKRVRVVAKNDFAQLLKVCDNPTLKALLEVAYPMLQDETCFFLAADFDKENWHEDIFRSLAITNPREASENE